MGLGWAELLSRDEARPTLPTVPCPLLQCTAACGGTKWWQ